jgi:hypothetical protein
MVEMREKRNARNMPEGHFDEDKPLAIPVCHKEVGEAFDFAMFWPDHADRWAASFKYVFTKGG